VGVSVSIVSSAHKIPRVGLSMMTLILGCLAHLSKIQVRHIEFLFELVHINVSWLDLLFHALTSTTYSLEIFDLILCLGHVVFNCEGQWRLVM
jgi:hypothetical protein